MRWVPNRPVPGRPAALGLGGDGNLVEPPIGFGAAFCTFFTACLADAPMRCVPTGAFCKSPVHPQHQPQVRPSAPTPSV